jgi:hypothetical protein
MLVYFASPRFRAYVETIGLGPITFFHIWRVPAALLFFWYGANGELPTAFWVLAGTGDFIAGSYAAPQVGEESRIGKLGEHALLRLRARQCLSDCSR